MGGKVVSLVQRLSVQVRPESQLPTLFWNIWSMQYIFQILYLLHKTRPLLCYPWTCKTCFPGQPLDRPDIRNLHSKGFQHQGQSQQSNKEHPQVLGMFLYKNFDHRSSLQNQFNTKWSSGFRCEEVCINTSWEYDKYCWWKERVLGGNNCLILTTFDLYFGKMW